MVGKERKKKGKKKFIWMEMNGGDERKMMGNYIMKMG